MIKFILVALTVVLFLILSIPLLLFFRITSGRNPRRWDHASLAIVQWIFRLVLKLAGVRVKAVGTGNIPHHEAVLYVSNHRSYFDILAGYTTVPGCTGFIAKKEMEKIWLLSNWMRHVNCLFLDRKNLKEGLKTILEGIQKIKDGISIWICPEGTRNSDGDLLNLLPFKEGSLKIAEKSGCLIIPVAISGTAEIFEQHMPRIKSSQVTIQYGKPIRLKELGQEEQKHAGAYVRQVIIEMLENRENAG